MTEPMLNPEFLESLQQAISQVSTRDVGPITADRPIRDLGLDSLSIAELLVVLEDRLDVTLEQSEIERVRTFGDLQDLVTRVRAGAR